MYFSVALFENNPNLKDHVNILGIRENISLQRYANYYNKIGFGMRKLRPGMRHEITH